GLVVEATQREGQRPGGGWVEPLYVVGRPGHGRGPTAGHHRHLVIGYFAARRSFGSSGPLTLSALAWVLSAAAGDGDIAAGDERCRWRDQPRHGGRDFLGSAHATEWGVCGRLFRLRRVRHHLGGDDAW